MMSHYIWNIKMSITSTVTAQCKYNSETSSRHELFVAALENGQLVARTPESAEMWTASGPQITTQIVGFDDLHWCGRWNSMRGQIEVRDEIGTLVASAETSRPRVSDSSENRIGFGFEDGQILIWERELFHRRSKQENVEENSRNSALAAKLRSLRK